MSHPYGYGLLGKEIIPWDCGQSALPTAKVRGPGAAQYNADAAGNYANLPKSTLEKRP